MSVLHRFYTASAQRDWAAMGACYHPDARFSDPVFADLDASGVRAMWRMLLTSGTDLRVTFQVIEENANSGLVRWEAWYTFSRTKRPVHNIITAEFILKDGLILVHRDRFELLGAGADKPSDCLAFSRASATHTQRCGTPSRKAR